MKDGKSGLFLIFHLNDRLYGMSVNMVREIIPMVEITPVPNAPAAVKGIINLRGVIVPIVDLRRKLKLAERSADEHTCIVVVDAAPRPFGFMADRVTDCLELNDLSPPEEAGGKASPEQALVHGVGQHQGRIVILLDLSRMVTVSERKALASL